MGARLASPHPAHYRRPLPPLQAAPPEGYVSPPARFRQAPRSLRGIVEADETSSSSLSRAVGPICRERRESGAERPGMLALIRTTFPSFAARDRKAATFEAVLPQFDGASVGPPSPVSSRRQSSHRRRRQGDRRFRPKSRDSVPCRAVAGKTTPRRLASTSTTSTPTTVA